MTNYNVISSPTFEDIDTGDTIEVVTGWGTGKAVFGEVVSKEKDFMGDRNVVDYHIDGEPHDRWAYDYQVTKLIKEID
jgi:hypothetical protein